MLKKLNINKQIYKKNIDIFQNVIKICIKDKNPLL